MMLVMRNHSATTVIVDQKLPVERKLGCSGPEVGARYA